MKVRDYGYSYYICWAYGVDRRNPEEDVEQISVSKYNALAKEYLENLHEQEQVLVCRRNGEFFFEVGAAPGFDDENPDHYCIYISLDHSDDGAVEYLTKEKEQEYDTIHECIGDLLWEALQGELKKCVYIDTFLGEVHGYEEIEGTLPLAEGIKPFYGEHLED